MVFTTQPAYRLLQSAGAKAVSGNMKGSMMKPSVCEACGIKVPNLATGKGPNHDPMSWFKQIPNTTSVRYIGRSRLCVSCRFAPTLPGHLVPEGKYARKF